MRWLIPLAVGLAACSGPPIGLHDDDGGAQPDAGERLDSGYPSDDAGVPDSGPFEDAGRPDAGRPDAGRPDAGPPDAGGMPIRYIIVLIKENHTFDNYFAGFPGATSSLTAKLSDGTTLVRPIAPNPDAGIPRDISHSHASAITAFHGGSMDGFDRVSGANPPTGPTDHLPFIRYTEAQIPNYWKYARTFVLADHYFSTAMGPSFPGHLASTTAQGLVLDNGSCVGCDAGPGGCFSSPPARVTTYDPVTCAISSQYPCWDIPSLPDSLPAGLTWAEYGWNTLLSVKSLAQQPGILSHFKSGAALLNDLKSGNQANLIFAHMEGSTSEHPPQAICPGENATVALINAAMSGPHWDETAILLTWDDWGGFYDSVAPPATRCSNGDYLNPGFRLPMIIISPYARQGYVLQTPTEQASIPRLVEDLWKMPRLAARDPHARDAIAGSFLGAFDFAQPPRPPLILVPQNCH